MRSIHGFTNGNQFVVTHSDKFILDTGIRVGGSYAVTTFPAGYFAGETWLRHRGTYRPNKKHRERDKRWEWEHTYTRGRENFDLL
jgi:hypothetical protein